MPDEENQPLDDNNLGDSNAPNDKNKQQPSASQEGGGTARVITPEGLIMFTLAACLDGAGLALIGLDAAFGIGLAFGPNSKSNFCHASAIYCASRCSSFN